MRMSRRWNAWLAGADSIAVNLWNRDRLLREGSAGQKLSRSPDAKFRRVLLLGGWEILQHWLLISRLAQQVLRWKQRARSMTL